MDESSLNIDTTFELDSYEAGMSIASCFLKDNLDGNEKEYIVVGTAFVIPEEPQPTRGRILVFEITTTTSISNEMQRQITLVVDIPTKGTPFSLATSQGRLVAGIDSKVIFCCCEKSFLIFFIHSFIIILTNFLLLLFQFFKFFKFIT